MKVEICLRHPVCLAREINTDFCMHTPIRPETARNRLYIGLDVRANYCNSRTNGVFVTLIFSIDADLSLASTDLR